MEKVETAVLRLASSLLQEAYEAVFVTASKNNAALLTCETMFLIPTPPDSAKNPSSDIDERPHNDAGLKADTCSIAMSPTQVRKDDSLPLRGRRKDGAAPTTCGTLVPKRYGAETPKPPWKHPGAPLHFRLMTADLRRTLTEPPCHQHRSAG